METTVLPQQLVLAEADLDELELALGGAFDRVDGTAVLDIDQSRLSGDGTVELLDPEGTPIGSWRPVGPVRERRGRRVLPGEVTARRPLERGPFRALRQPARAVRPLLGRRDASVHAFRGAPTTSQVDALRDSVERGDDVWVAALVGSGAPVGVDGPGLVRAVRAAAPDAVRHLVVPVPGRTVEHAEAILRAYGFSSVTLHDPPGPEDRLPEESARELARSQPPASRRGAVVLFTGYSGSGKSTIARLLVEGLQESGARDATLLDGDEVRRMLSAGLGYERADRELNVRRIGYVAALVARHGGVAVCAPIAPHAAVRAEVRGMAAAVGEFVLVHVSTPLEVCEARDRKGLYAKARAGLIPNFTGISDDYEAPDDADLVLDTSHMEPGDAVDAVERLLTARGLLPAGMPDGPAQ